MTDQDYEKLDQLQTQVYELKMSLGVMCCLMQDDMDLGKVHAGPTRTAEVEKAYNLSRFT